MLGALRAPRQNMIVFENKFDQSKPIGSLEPNKHIELGGSQILVGYQNGWVSLYDFTSRSNIWWQAIKGDLSAAAMMDGRTAVSSTDGVLYFLDSKTGKLIWQQKHQGFVEKKPIKANCGIAVQTANELLYCFDQTSGKEVFNTPLGGTTGRTTIRSYSQIVSSGNFLWLGSNSGTLVKIDGSSGRIIQKSNPAQVGGKFKSIVGEIVVGSDYIIFGEYNGNIQKVSKQTLKPLQSVSLGRLYDLASHNGEILVSTKNHQLKSLSKSDLKELWTYQHDENISYLKNVEGQWYGVGSRGSIVSVDSKGKQRWSDFLETELRPEIFACGSSVCFSSASSSLYSYQR